MSEKPIVLLKLCCKNKISGIAIKPEKEIAFPILTRSFNIKFDGFKKNWKNTSEIKEVNITKIIFTIRSLKVKL